MGLRAVPDQPEPVAEELPDHVIRLDRRPDDPADPMAELFTAHYARLAGWFCPQSGDWDTFATFMRAIWRRTIAARLASSSRISRILSFQR